MCRFEQVVPRWYQSFTMVLALTLLWFYFFFVLVDDIALYIMVSFCFLSQPGDYRSLFDNVVHCKLADQLSLADLQSNACRGALVQKKQQQGLLHEQEGHPSTGQPQILKKKNRQHKHCHIFRQISCFSTLAPVFFGTFTRDLLHDVVNYLNVLRSAMFIGMAAFRRPWSGTATGRWDVWLIETARLLS